MRPLDPKDPSVEQVLAGLASGSHGVVARRELLEAGVTRAEVKWRLRTGSLIPVHPGVYRVGHAAPSLLSAYSAAVMACGDRALLAGRAAARLHCLLRGSPQPEVIAQSRRHIHGVLTSVREFEPNEAMVYRGIPVTTVPRTLIDLAAVLSSSHLARVVHEATFRHDLDPDDVDALLGRRHNWPGCRELRAVLHGDIPVTLSRLESRFLERLRAARLPKPVVNARVGGRYVDCRWPEHRLTVELDGYRYHRTRHAWEQDRRREREARARGDDFRRFSYSDVFEDPCQMLRELRECLSRAP